MCDSLEQEFYALADAYETLMLRCEIQEQTLAGLRHLTHQAADAFGLLVRPQKRVTKHARALALKPQILDRYRAGQTYEQIHRDLNVSIATVSQYVRAAGLKTRQSKAQSTHGRTMAKAMQSRRLRAG